MKKVFLIVSILFLTSCSSNKDFIYYTYNNVTITRLDNGNEIYFYYGKIFNDKELPNSYIKTSYSGFDGLMSGYVVFKENKSIELIEVDGSFERINPDDRLKLKKLDNIKFIDWNDSIEGNYNNILEVSDIIKIEKTRNKKNHSKVKAVYPK